jgi:DNA-binding SARP family transcriptional activator/Flp pilus assembly protein TadD
VWVQILGSVRAWRGGSELALGPPGQRALFGLLALADGQPLSRAQLIDALWSDQPPNRAVNVIQTYVKRLRRLLEPEREPRSASVLLPAVGTGYALHLPAGSLDAAAFRDLVGAASAVAADPHGMASLLGEALGLWQATPLADAPALADHPMVVSLIRERHAALGPYAEAMIATGGAAEALPLLAQAAAGQPLDEAAQARLIHTYNAAGQRDRAFAVYEETRRRLADELGIGPGPQLAEAHAALLREAVAEPGAAIPEPSPATVTVAPGPAQLPADILGFTGRCAESAALSDLLDIESAGVGPGIEQDAAGVIAAVSGTAGVGKTAFVVHWAHGVRDRFPDGQLYVNLRGYGSAPPVEPGDALAGFLTALGVPPGGCRRRGRADGAVSQPADRQADAGRAGQRARRRAGPPAAAVLRELPRRGHQPQPDAGLIAAEGAKPLALDPLSVEEATDLLANRLGPERAGAEPAAVAEIVGHCARLPLALALVAARAALHPRFPLAAIAAELRADGDRLNALSVDGADTDLRRMFSWSYETLHPAAARMFRLLALHPGPDISVRAAASLGGLPLREARGRLSELARAHLLEEHEPDRYTFHDLLRIYAIELAQAGDGGPRDQQAEQHEAVLRVLDHYLHTAYAAALLLDPTRKPFEIPLDEPHPGAELDPPTDHDQAYAWLVAEQDGLVAAVGWAVATGLDTHAWQLAWAVSVFLDRQGRWHDRLAVHTAGRGAALRLRERSGQAHMHLGLANTYARMGRFEEARADLGRALDLFTEAGDDAGQANVHLLNLAFAVRSLGDRYQALDHTRAALDLYTAAANLAARARIQHESGRHRALERDYQRAYQYCEQALDLLQDAEGRYGEAEAWHSLGYIHQHCGDHRQAVTCYQRSLILLDRVEDRPRSAEVLVRIGDAHFAGGDEHAAGRSWNQALAILADTSHPDTNLVRDRLATLSVGAVTVGGRGD